ncbi:MAG: tetratricopeptide repeat protein [Treponema sp.]|nr:tetratricopeptide repeat protein [Treponema sp.]
MSFFSLNLFFYNSCISSGRLVPAGEETVIMQNEAIEAFSAGKEYESNKKYKSAISCYEKSMQYDKLYDSAYYKIGRCYALMGEWKRAEEVFSSILIKDPNNSYIKDSLGYVYANDGKPDQAEELYESLVLENPFNSDFCYKYIKILLQNGKIYEATNAFNDFKSSFPRNKDEIKTLENLLLEQQGNSDTSAD